MAGGDVGAPQLPAICEVFPEVERQEETAESLGVLGGEKACGIEAAQQVRFHIFTPQLEARIRLSSKTKKFGWLSETSLARN